VAQRAAEQEKAVATTATQAATMKAGEGQAMPSQGQAAEEAETEEGGTDLRTTSTQLKRQHLVERAGLWKKIKASILSIDPITLIKGDLHDISETVCDVTNEALHDFMQEHQTILGAIRLQLQDLQVHPPRLVPF